MTVIVRIATSSSWQQYFSAELKVFQYIQQWSLKKRVARVNICADVLLQFHSSDPPSVLPELNVELRHVNKCTLLQQKKKNNKSDQRSWCNKNWRASGKATWEHSSCVPAPGVYAYRSWTLLTGVYSATTEIFPAQCICYSKADQLAYTAGRTYSEIEYGLKLPCIVHLSLRNKAILRLIPFILLARFLLTLMRTKVG